MSLVNFITEGGQTWGHRIRMFRQVIKMTLFMSFCVGGITFLLLLWQVPSQYFNGAWYHIKANTVGQITDTINVQSSSWEKISRERHTSDVILLSSTKVAQQTKPYYDSLLSKCGEFLITAGWTIGFSYIGLITFFLIRGRLVKNKQHISGKKQTWPLLLKAKLILTRKASKLKIGSIPLIKNAETQHMMITGGTGSGKTNCLFHMLDQIRKQGQRAIIVDTSGSFIQRYYRQGKDTILNPYHPEGKPWHPWVECETQFDYDNLSESFIPHSFNDNENYWRQAGRTLLSSLLQKFEGTQKTSELTRWFFFEPLANLCQLVQGTKAAAHMDVSSEKTSSSVRSVSSSFLGCLESLEDTDQPFSIRNWVEQGSGWLFLQCTPSQRSSISPLLSAWISVAIRTLLNLEPALNRRLWFVLDELPTLNKIKDLPSLLTEGRKYGGCGVLSFQSPAQLEAIYGRQIAQTIIGNCRTKIIFSEQDPEIASKISRSFGEREVKEFNEGITYGAHEVRDGVSLSTQKRQQAIVTATEIQSLNNNQAYLKLPGNYSVAKVRLKIAR